MLDNTQTKISSRSDGSRTPSPDLRRSSSKTRAHVNVVVEEVLADEQTPLLGTADNDTDNIAASSTPSTKNPYLGGVTVTRFWLLFSQVMINYFVASFDGTIMASSHPVITSYFGSSNSASWLSTAFLLTSTSFQPVLGGLSDAVGRKAPYIVTIAVFLVATAWCALAGSMASFIAARAVCGLGAGGMLTLGSIIVSDIVPIE